MFIYEYDADGPLELPSFDVFDSGTVQPIGFIWHTKPRYRIKAIGRKW